MKKILIAVPTNKYVETQTMKSIYDLIVPEGYITELQFFHGYVIDEVRNLIAEWAKQYDYLLAVDSDIIVPPDALVKMLGADKDIITGMYIQRIPQTHTLEIYKDLSNGGVTNIDISELSADEIVEIAACGFGCILIKGEVFRTIEYPHFVYRSAIENRQRVTEDIYFCSNARKHGFSIYVDTSLKCQHVGTFNFTISG